MAAVFKQLRLQNGGYYFVCNRDANGKRKWLHLGRDRDAALRRYSALAGGDPSEASAVAAHLRKVFFAARRRAKVSGIDFALTREQFDLMVSRSAMRCELTGIPFSLSWVHGNKHRRPFVPSLDRVDSMLPYTYENCRLVLCAVNYALNEWGEAVLRKIATGLLVDKAHFGAHDETAREA
jgi:hypothetical protein